MNRAGVSTTVEESDRPRVPAIMIGEATQALMKDVFDNQSLFDGLHKITKRVVAWGPNAEPSTLPHSAVVISEQGLCERLRAPTHRIESGTSEWAILTSRPLPEMAAEQRFGTRMAKASRVQLAQASDPSSCWIESLENGWLFLIPHSSGEALLLEVGQASLERSRLIAPQIQPSVEAGVEFPAFPRIIDPLCSDGWLACGSAAMAFDPICGDGTGNAVREAILAAAVIRADGPANERLDHYRRRLIAGFLRHLDQCRQFYSTGHTTDWWREEHDHLLRGMRWCQTALAPQRDFRYQLRGFDLEPIGPC